MLYCFADCETTGVALTDRIVELAYAIYDEDLVLVNKDQSLIDPLMQIPSGASAVHHITNAMVATEPTIDEFMEMKNYPLQTDEPMLFIAHNAPFDIRYFGPHMHADTKTLCTLRLSKRLFPGLDSYKLQALRYSLNLPDIEGDAHRADFDVEMLVSLVLHMMATTGKSIEELYEMSTEPLAIETMPFGKHRGKTLKEVPLDYFQWLFKQDNLDADLKASILKLHPKLA